MERKILSLDWDWFTGDCYSYQPHPDCGWGCCGREFEHTLPIGRGKASKGRRVGTTKRLAKTFAELLGPRPGILFAECHGTLARYLKDGDHIFNVDAHPDNATYYGNDRKFKHGKDNCTCGNWINYARKIYKAKHITYMYFHSRRVAKRNYNYLFYTPQFIMKGVGEPDLIFVCKSSPWTPTTRDHILYEMLNGITDKKGPTFCGHYAEKLRAEFEKHTSLTVGS